LWKKNFPESPWNTKANTGGKKRQLLIGDQTWGRESKLGKKGQNKKVKENKGGTNLGEDVLRGRHPRKKPRENNQKRNYWPREKGKLIIKEREIERMREGGCEEVEGGGKKREDEGRRGGKGRGKIARRQKAVEKVGEGCTKGSTREVAKNGEEGEKREEGEGKRKEGMGGTGT